MANLLDEMNPQTMDQGRDVNVIAKQIPVTVTASEQMIPTIISGVGVLLAVLGVIIQQWGMLIFLLLPLYVYKKMASTSSYFSGLEQKINAFASEIDNYMEQKVIILTDTANLVNKSIDLDKELFTNIAKYRSGNISDLSKADSAIRSAERSIQIALENYPDLKSQDVIADAMQKNNYLQREITAARSAYNDAVFQWNREIFIFPFNKIVAAKEGKTTRIPFIAAKETKERSRGEFFN